MPVSLPHCHAHRAAHDLCHAAGARSYFIWRRRVGEGQLEAFAIVQHRLTRVRLTPAGRKAPQLALRDRGGARCPGGMMAV